MAAGDSSKIETTFPIGHHTSGTRNSPGICRRKVVSENELKVITEEVEALPCFRIFALHFANCARRPG
jgi:hypothetical protein